MIDYYYQNQNFLTNLISQSPTNPFQKQQDQKQCGLFCLLGRDQKIEMKLGCENIISQNTIVQRIGLIERLTF